MYDSLYDGRQLHMYVCTCNPSNILVTSEAPHIILLFLKTFDVCHAVRLFPSVVINIFVVPCIFIAKEKTITED